MMLVLSPFLISSCASVLMLLLNNNILIWSSSIIFALLLVFVAIHIFLSSSNIIESYVWKNINNINEFSFNFFDGSKPLEIGFQFDKLNIIFFLGVSILNLIATLYSVGYMKANHEKCQSKFFFFFNASILSTIGIAFAKNLFTTFAFYEMLTLFTYPLVVHCRDKKSYDGGNKYFQLLMSTSNLFFLPALLIVHSLGVDGFYLNLNLIPDHISILLFFLFAFGIAKAALFPVHGWLNSAMVAPAPVSALLHAVAVVKSGVFILIKICIFTFSLSNNSFSFLLTVTSAITIIIASLYAISAKEIKQMLAYSTISQLSYILIIASLFSANAIKIAMFYIFSHSFAKMTLFFCAGSIYTQTHKKYISEIAGLFRILPLTGICFIIGAFAMIGLPPTMIYYAKHYAFEESVSLGNYFVPLILSLSTGMTSIYYLRIIYIGFFHELKDKVVTTNSTLMLFSMIITSLASLIFSLFSSKIISVL